ncbi:hypothetical protein [Streptomyces sp. NPDC006668]|uniref:hypothetical protein n=1 Tax=Streptomyces sp. NPDC006668 TaxID=3156903 RepID=UPI0033EA4678
MTQLAMVVDLFAARPVISRLVRAGRIGRDRAAPGTRRPHIAAALLTSGHFA